MSFPSVVERLTTEGNGVSSLAVNIGSPSSGQRLVMLYGLDDVGSLSAPSGWSLVTGGGSGNGLQLRVLTRVADGSEGATVTVTNPTTCRCRARVWRISAGTHTDVFAEATTTSASSTFPDPPTLSPSAGSADYLWIAANIHSPPRSTLTEPTGYSNSASQGGLSDVIRMRSVDRTATGSSEDPATFELNASAAWLAITFAIQGTASGGSAIAAISSGYHLRGMR